MKKKNQLSRSISENTKALLSLEKQKKKIDECIKLIFRSLKKDGKILLSGNGGSAADAQHLAAEFLVRLRPKVNRMPLPAISLATDISTKTACGNDYDFDQIFTRPFEALAKK